MSGGGNRKKNTRSQGWEDAGSDFYQESYPLDPEFEVLQNDPKHLHTLLPSKQTRAAVATIRMRTNDYRSSKSTVRRHTASRTRSRRDSTVHRRTSTIGGDVQLSMLPDLSEMKTNEESAWEEVMRLKELPIPMAQKREMKNKIMNEPNLRLQGYENFNWKRRKLWTHLEGRVREFLQKIELWKGSLRHIEGNFGTGVVAFFLFVKWLFLLNCGICLLIFLYLTLPTILLDYEKTFNCTDSSLACSCTESYFNSSQGENNVVLEVMQGTGFLERTILFYGFYSNKVLSYMLSSVEMYYNIPLAYILVMLACFLISLVLILRSAAEGFKERLVESEGQFYLYCNLVFGGWDFCIDNEKAARTKHKAIYNEIKAALETEKLTEERQGRTRKEQYKIFMSRLVVNILVVVILIGCGIVIYYTFDFSTKKIVHSTEIETNEKLLQLLYEFLPSMVIVSMNIIVPFIFRFLINFEKYTPIVEIRFTLIRTVFLRLASLVVLYASLLTRITCAHPSERSCTPCVNSPECWETFVGQQIFKLLVTDFGTHVILTFIVNFVRALLAKHLNNKFFEFIGEQTFDLSKHALDVVYTQTLCWFGMFYAPLLSLLAAVMFFFLFYIKKFNCVINCKPSPVIYRASRSHSMFMVVLLVSYLFAVLPIAYSIYELMPSKSCGPFSGENTVWSLVVDLFMSWPDWIQKCVFYLNTPGFVIPFFIVLVLLLYYYSAINSANRHMVVVLKNQLVLEGHDKQFLLDRLSLFIKQENQKRARAEQMRDRDRDRDSDSRNT
nr:unnamed protein product [Callosobruchus analis]